MNDEKKENVKIIKDWFKQYYEKPEKVTSFMLDQEDRIKELETINEEHRKLNGTLHEELDKYKNIVDEIKKDLYNILHNLEKYDETAGYVPEHLEYATNYTEQAIDKLKKLKGE